MNKKIIILGVVFSTLMITSCVKDLNVTPSDPNVTLASNLTADEYKQVLAKI